MPIKIAKSQSHESPRELGMRAFKEKRWLEAINILGSTLSHGSRDAEAMRCIAIAHNALGDSKAARAMLGKAIDADHDLADAHRDMAVLLANDGRPLDAAEYACWAVEVDPWNDESLSILKRIRAQVVSLKPSSKKAKGKKIAGASQSRVDECLKRINSVQRKAAAAGSPMVSDSDKPTITLCVIAKNEEQFIGDCLSSVKGVADEIIVLDTGSTDRTREIAQSHGAIIHSEKWSDSYAAARNHALKHATSEWVLVLDADERLDKDAKLPILRAVRNPKFDGYALYFRNYTSPGTSTDYFVHRTCRLFRNRPAHRFVGRVHERIVNSIESAGGKVGEIEAVIHHHGYLPDIMRERGKHEKYVKLLLADLRENPTDVFCLYNLGAAYSTHGDHEDARIYLEMAAESVTAEHEFAAAVFVGLAKAYCEMKQPAKAIEAIEQAESKQIVNPELPFSKGNALLALNRNEEAVAAFQCAIAIGEKGQWLGDPGAYGYKAYYGIGKAYMALGGYEFAVNACKKALALNPDDAQTHELIGAAYLSLNRAQDAERHLQRSGELKPGSPQTTMRLADALEQQKRYSEAQARYSELITNGHETAELRFKMGLSMHRSGDHVGAEESYARAIELRPDYPQAHTALGLLYGEQGKLAEAMDSFAAAVTADSTYSDAYFHAADLLFASEKYAEAADVYQSGIASDPSNAKGFLGLGNCYFRMGAQDAAVMAYRQALKIKPDYAEARNNLALIELPNLRKAA